MLLEDDQRINQTQIEITIEDLQLIEDSILNQQRQTSNINQDVSQQSNLRQKLKDNTCKTLSIIMQADGVYNLLAYNEEDLKDFIEDSTIAIQESKWKPQGWDKFMFESLIQRNQKRASISIGMERCMDRYLICSVICFDENKHLVVANTKYGNNMNYEMGCEKQGSLIRKIYLVLLREYFNTMVSIIYWIIDTEERFFKQIQQNDWAKQHRMHIQTEGQVKTQIQRLLDDGDDFQRNGMKYKITDAFFQRLKQGQQQLQI
ncbi:unnamed protein product [Paramecium sonneborni]|uniref:Uncharacterized protein n=1 Tax=Paramecium sonneborni TaxID=65129 RepID=A0A8S1N458_9CILI|nr:unnamed protein product [Paramecium sonneborni]